MQQTADDFSFAISSNLDNLVANELKNIASGEVKQARDKLENRIRQETEKYKTEKVPQPLKLTTLDFQLTS